MGEKEILLKPLVRRTVPFLWRARVARFLFYEIPYFFWRRGEGRGARLERPLFILGSPRSGTWLTVGLIEQHPEVANWSEAHRIWDPKYYRNPQADHHWTAADVRPRDVERLHARFEYHRRFLRKQRFVNKNPRNSVRIDYIRAVFPDALFLHVIRDGRAVIASMLEFMRRNHDRVQFPMPMERPPNWRALVREDKVEQVALQWRAIVEYVLSKREELGQAYHEIRYEELCERPREVMEAAFHFAGLGADEEILSRLPARLEPRNDKWKKQLTAEQIRLVTRIQEPLLRRLGYPVE